MSRAVKLFAAVCCALALCSPPAWASTTVGGGVVGRAGLYDYSPTMIQTGSGTAAVQQFWWCGARNAGDPSWYTDTVQYEEIALSPLHVVTGPVTVLGERTVGWDSAFTCNPRVVAGTYVNPLGDGVTYTYAMYYVGTSQTNGTDNSIGVAFSADGQSWRKYPNPVIYHTSTGGVYYGAGQPTAVNTSGTAGSAIQLVYENSNGPAGTTTHILETSPDGVHFTAAGTLSTTGLTDPHASIGDLAYNPAAGAWYGLYEQPTRPPATTGGFVERGQPGETLYTTTDLLAGAWTPLDTIDTNLTGYEANFLGSFLRNPDGTVLPGTNGTIEVYQSTSMPRPAANSTPLQRGQSGDVTRWDIAWSAWTPGAPLRAFTRYYSPTLAVHEVTTGWADTSTFGAESTLAHLYEAPTGAFTRPVYGCVQGSDDYFTSLDAACESQLTLGLDGYLDPNPATGLVALYRCYTGTDHFVSTDPGCEGTTTEKILGYAAP